MHTRQTTDAQASTFASRLRTALTDAGITASELARQCGVATSTVQNILTPQRGRNSIGSRYVREFAQVLGVSQAWLATGDGFKDSADAVLAPSRVPVLPDLLRGLTRLQAGALDSLASLLRAGKIPDRELLRILAEAHELEAAATPSA